MPYQTKLTPEELEKLLAWAKEGKGYTAISRLLDGKITKQRVKQICLKHRIDSFSIRQQQNETEKLAKLTKKWGNEWLEKEKRRDYVYQAMREKFRSKRANAVRIGKPWDLDFGDLVFPTHCPILNVELDYFAEQAQDNSPSFDCLIPSKGYVKGNVFIVSWRANRVKNDGTAEEHRLIASFIEQHA